MTSNLLVAELSDDALIRRFLSGDEPGEIAFRTLYQRHTPRLRMLLIRLLGPRRGEVEDLLQETWMAGCRGLHRFRGDAKFSTWLTTIAIRATRSRLRLKINDEVDLDDSCMPSVRAHTRTEGIDLERAMEHLSDRQRAVLVLHDVEGFTHEEIAAELECAVGTSRATLSRARAALRAMLTDGVVYA